MYIARSNTKYLEMGLNSSSIVIGPVSQTGQTNISTVINGVRIDSNLTNNNLFISSGNTSYMVTSSNPNLGINGCNTALSNTAFSTNPMTGDHCTAVGHNCLTKNSTGIWNTGIGADTLSNVLTGNHNTALGGFALTNTTDSNQVAIGFQALKNSVAAQLPNVAVGCYALQSQNNSGAGANVAIGHSALGSAISGTGNVAIGYLAGNAPATGTVTTSGSNSVSIGNQATSKNFDHCVCIGAITYPTANNQIILGYAGGPHTTYIQGSGGLLVNGNVGIGTTTPAYKLDVNNGDARVTGTTTLAKTTINTITNDRAGQIILNNTIYTNNTTPYNIANGVIDTITSAGDNYNPDGNDSTAKAIMIKGPDLNYSSANRGIWNRTGLGGNVLIRAGGSLSGENNGAAEQTLKGGHVYIDSGTAACGVIQGTDKSASSVTAIPGNIYLRCGALPINYANGRDYFSSTYDTKMTVTPTEITTNVRMRITEDVGTGTITRTTNSQGLPVVTDTMTPIAGSLVIEHGNAGGGSSIVFPSANNRTSDFGYFRYRDDVENNGYGYERSRLEIGLENDYTDATYKDSLILQKNGGYVGIGTVNPVYNLDVAGTASFAATRIYEETGTTMTSTTGSLVIQHNNSGGQSSIVFPSRNYSTDYGYIRFRDDYYNRAGGNNEARLEIGIESQFGPGAPNIDALVLNKTGGYVGIGTDFPAYNLDVAGEARMSTKVRCNIYDTNDTGAELQIGPSVTGTSVPPETGKVIRIGENIGTGTIVIGNGASQNGTISIAGSGTGARSITIGSSAATSNSTINLYGKVTTNNLTVGTTNTFKTNGPTIFGHNGAVGFPTDVPLQDTGVALGWNINSGQGDTSFLNYPQGGFGGFRFYTKSYYTVNNNVSTTLAPITCGSLDTSGGAILAAVSGNVGIGTTNPGYKLDVNGTGRFTGTLTGAGATFSGNVGIGTTSPQYAFHIIGGNAGIDGNLSLKVLYSSEGIEIFNTQRWSIGRRTTSTGLFIQPGTGGVNNGLGVSLLATETSWGSASDRRLKKNIVPMESMINKVMQVNPVRYNFIDVPGDRVGFIAQEFMNYFPEFVSECEGTLRITYTEMISVLTKCIQEEEIQIINLQKENDELKSTIETHQIEINDLKTKNELLESRLSAIEARLAGF